MSGNKQIVVFTNGDDEHLPFVSKHLQNSELVVVNPLAVIDGTGLSYEFDGRYIRVHYGEYDLTDTRAVWYRKPERIKQEHVPVEEEFADYAVSALRIHTGYFPDCLPNAMWVSDLRAIHRAESKPGQLVLARELGMNVPPTLITSDTQRAKQFVESAEVRGETCIVKRLANKFPNIHGVPHALFTRRIESSSNFEGLNLAPAIFQVAVETSYSLRVTVVNGEVFASRTDYQDDQVIDWRYTEDPGWQPHRLSEDSVRACATLVKRLGLLYGTIDLLVDEDGVEWFLEINSNGQWAFVDDETTFLIGQALARLLENPTERECMG